MKTRSCFKTGLKPPLHLLLSKEGKEGRYGNKGFETAWKTIYLVRHGAVDRRYEKRFIGRKDVPLSAKGRQQAKSCARWFRNRPGLVCLCSPLRRCVATARLAAPRLNGTLRINRDLREMDFGGWEGLTFDEIRQRDPLRVTRWARFDPGFRFPKGERLRSFRTRLRRLERFLLRHPANELLVVSHGGIIRSLLCLWKGKDISRYPEIQVSSGSVSVVRVRGGKPHVDSTVSASAKF